MVKVLEVRQGHWRDLSGRTLESVLDLFQKNLAERQSKASYKIRPEWLELEVDESAPCNWGYEWYIVEDGRLRLWKTNYDSSG